MRKTLITLVAVLSLVGAAPASAHLITRPKCDRLTCIETSQQENLKHARYVCNNGAHQTKRWNCLAVKWLTRELNQTRAALQPPISEAWSCIHHYEGAWNSNTGNGYYGGLQMDIRFMNTYGLEFVKRWGTADNWPIWAQIQAAQRAHDSGRGYGPWPKTSRMCGL